jgi:phosphoglucosamine mutase
MSDQRRLFGTDGIRGRANDYPMTPEMALMLGRAVAHVFRRDHRPDKGRPRIVIGKDTRLSNYMFETALQAGICSMGVDAVQLGVLPTPGIAFMTTGMRADAGVVISASHNPYDDNGIKFFAADGYKLPDEVERQIEDIVRHNDIAAHRAHGADIGRAYRIADAGGRYAVSLKSTLPRNLSLDGMRIVIDCANGAAYKVAPEVLYELGAEVIPLGTSPDGTNINDNIGALHPDVMAKKVREMRADLGIALDGDADRVILCDADGHIIDGDHILLILARRFKAQGRLPHATAVATVMSNLGLERALAREGIHMERVAVGDRYVVERMREGGFTLGGEQSGHIVMTDFATTGDGLLAALQVLAAMVEGSTTLAALARGLTHVPQVMVGVRVAKKPPLESLPSVVSAIAAAEAQIGDGRVLVRYSGTEPKCRVMLEGDNEALIRHHCDAIAKAVELELAP